MITHQQISIFFENINKKFWNWHEIKDKDIKDTCLKYNFRGLYGE